MLLGRAVAAARTVFRAVASRSGDGAASELNEARAK
jgi:hypothetical protein